MKFKTLAVAAAVGAPLILTGSASADFVGITTVSKDITGFEDFVAKVVNLYAIFSDDDGDGIGDGSILVCAGTLGQPLNICVRDGVFYQNPLNSNNNGRTAPSQGVVDIFPELAVDTFVTIGLKVVPQGHIDQTVLTAGFPKFGLDCLLVGDGGWFVLPDDLQGHPNNFDNPPDAVLIGQFSVAAGAGPNPGVSGTLLIQGFHGDGRPFQEYLSFDSQIECQNDPDCDDGNPCNGQEACVDEQCQTVAPSPDCNGNGVLDSCDIADGTSEDCNGNGIPDECDIAGGTSQDINGNGVPDECECLPDLDGSGNVGVKDLLILLGAWGPCPK